MNKIIKSILNSSLFLLSIGGTGCSDSFLDPNLSQSKDFETSINTVKDLQTILNGGYSLLKGYSCYGRNLIIKAEARSDNIAPGNSFSDGDFMNIFSMKMTADNGEVNSLWQSLYTSIQNANIVINKERVSGNTKELAQIKGQAYILRALAHFDLLRFYGQQFINGQGGMGSMGIPYVMTVGVPEFMYPKRETVNENYVHLMQDLDYAISIMNPSLDNPTKHFFSFYAAHALKARIATYFKKYDIAEKEAEIVIDSRKYLIASAKEYANTFLNKSGANIIFSLAMSETDNLGTRSLASIYRGIGQGNVIVLKELYECYEAEDIRKSFIKPTEDNNWEYINLGKYPKTDIPTDDIPVIRFEEVVLIYAEALLNNGKSYEALSELNKIPSNRNAILYTQATIQNILLERRKEFAFEGLRFDDLARNHQDIPMVDPLRQRFKNVKAGDYSYAFPIPQTEININKNLKQNYGY